MAVPAASMTTHALLRLVLKLINQGEFGKSE
jgi:hypothetical protein